MAVSKLYFQKLARDYLKSKHHELVERCPLGALIVAELSDEDGELLPHQSTAPDKQQWRVYVNLLNCYPESVEEAIYKVLAREKQKPKPELPEKYDLPNVVVEVLEELNANKVDWPT
jgi:hypothetical protein